MKKFTSVSSNVIALPIKDIDTDMIIPAQFLTSVSRQGYGENLFRRLRENDTRFVFNNPLKQNAKILVADSNFGCGSSREHAVWALQGWGIEVVISKSFADIFSSNSGKNGLVLITLKEEIVDTLLQEAVQDSYRLIVNLEQQSIIFPNGSKLNFAYDSFRKHCILNGLDDIDYILSHSSEIAKYREKTATTNFFSSLTANH